MTVGERVENLVELKDNLLAEYLEYGWVALMVEKKVQHWDVEMDSKLAVGTVHQLVELLEEN